MNNIKTFENFNNKDNDIESVENYIDFVYDLNIQVSNNAKKELIILYKLELLI